MKDKLRIAIDQLQSHGATDLPLLYCSNLLVVDELLHPLHKMRQYEVKPKKERVLVHNIGTGCTEAFNQKAREFYLLGTGSNMEMHDYWMVLVCMFMGVLIYDNVPHILYRQHAANVVGAKRKNFFKEAWGVLSHTKSHRISMLTDFLNVYKDALSPADRRLISTVTNCQKSFLARMRMFFSFRYIGFTLWATVGFKARMLLNKIN